MTGNPDDYLKNVEIVNSYIINHKCRGDPMKKYDFKNFPKDYEKKIFLQLFVVVGKIYG